MVEKTVHAKAIDAMCDFEALSKDQRNEHGRYQFRGIDDVYNVLGPLLRKHRLMSRTETLDYNRFEYTTSKGTLMNCVAVKVRFTVFDDTGAELILAEIYGEGSDTGDKATSKANSTALKYAVFQSFMPPVEPGTVDDSDHDTPEPRSTGERKQGKQRASSGSGDLTDKQRNMYWAKLNARVEELFPSMEDPALKKQTAADIADAIRSEMGVDKVMKETLDQALSRLEKFTFEGKVKNEERF